jgi:hypothetical protein
MAASSNNVPDNMAQPHKTTTTADGKIALSASVFTLQPDILNLKSVYGLKEFLADLSAPTADG